MFKKFAKEVFIYGITSSISKFVGLFLVPIYTRFFSKEDYGTMDVIVTIVAISTVFGMMQLESAVARYYYNEKNDDYRKTMVSTAMWTIIIASLLIFVILIFFSSYLSLILFNKPIYSTIIVIGCLTIPFSNLTSFFTVIIRFKKKPFHYFLFQIFQIFSTIILTIYLIVFAKLGIVAVFCGQLLGFSISSVLMAVYLRKELTLIWKKDELKKMMRYSLPLVPAVAGNLANSYFNRFLMIGYLSLAEIGLYAVALKIASVFQLIGSAFRMAWAPFFWETFENDNNHKAIFVRIQKEFSALVLMLVIFVTLFSKELVLLLTTELYLPASQLIGLISLSMVINSVIMQITGIGPGIKKKTEYNTLIYFCSLAANIGALFIIVPTYGLIGVPISMLLGDITLLIAGWYNSERLYYVGFDKLSMFVNMLITIAIIILNLILSIPLFIKILFVLFLLLFIAHKYRSVIMQLLNKRLKQI